MEMRGVLQLCFWQAVLLVVSPAFGFQLPQSRDCLLRESRLNLLVPGLESSSVMGAAAASVAATNIPRAITLGGVPALGMAATTLTGLKIRTPPRVVGALQHFSAGILLTTVAKELLPEMVQAVGLAENLASGIGFFSGVGLLIGLGQILKEDGDEEETEANGIQEKATEKATDIESEEASSMKSNYRLRNRRMSRQKEAFYLAGEGVGDVVSAAGDASFFQTEPDNASVAAMTTNERADFTPKEESPEKPSYVKLLPTAFLIAIAVDAALDGLLIGISTATGDPSTGNILSASLLVESSFLGITIATALRGCNVPQTIQAAAALLGPAGTIFGSIVGGSIAPSLTPVGLAGLLGFGTSTILFMVAEELLLEAHEEEENHVWWVDFQLYTGFFASVMVEKLVGA